MAPDSKSLARSTTEAPRGPLLAAILAHEELWRFVRLCCVSAIVNGLGFAAYLGLTYAGLDPKLAATICYAAGVAVGFILNRSWTFRDSGRVSTTFIRYGIAYGIGYVADMAGLYAMVDLLHYPHAYVQLALIVVIAFGLYAAQRFWVFSNYRGAGRAA